MTSASAPFTGVRGPAWVAGTRDRLPRVATRDRGAERRPRPECRRRNNVLKRPGDTAARCPHVPNRRERNPRVPQHRRWGGRGVTRARSSGGGRQRGCPLDDGLLGPVRSDHVHVVMATPLLPFSCGKRGKRITCPRRFTQRCSFQHLTNNSEQMSAV